MKWLAPAVLVAVAAWLLLRPPASADAPMSTDGTADAPLPGADIQEPPTDDQQQTPTTFESLAVALSPSTYTSAGVSPDVAASNRRAFRDMISFSEGTTGPDGYRTMFGGKLAPDLADHPRQVFTFTNSRGQTLKTTAAGRYQFLASTWDDLAAKLQLPDFGPDSQDAACDELVRERGALLDVEAGRFSAAVAKCAKTWASLPGAGYAQPERKLSQLVAAYTAAGGVITEA